MPALELVTGRAAAGMWCVGFVAYEAAPAFDRAMKVRATDGYLPLVWFSVHDAPGASGDGSSSGVPRSLDDDSRHHAGGAPQAESAGGWLPDVDVAGFTAAIDEIRDGIGRGDFYQVNYTIRFQGDIGDGGALELYDRLRRVQPDAYAALIDTGEAQIVSASPELFFETRGRRITMRPMKGTSRRGRWPDEDDAAAVRLRESLKERAENVMIVDLIRNDVGKIARTGTVEVPALFEVERHPTVLQMTSTVTAELRDEMRLPEIFSAIFPCGSVTGAPKIAAMKSIARLERSPRGVYCGAIGVVRPGGDANFSVGIRTAVATQDGRCEYGAGAGITWDSSAEAERREVFAKAAILVEERPAFDLVETMLLRDGIVARAARHLERMASSARYFGFRDPTVAASRALEEAARRDTAGEHRLRLVADSDGTVAAHVSPLEPLPDTRVVAVCAEPVDPADVFLYHKTTQRAPYEARRRAHPDAFDVLLVNDSGQPTEFTVGNLVVELDGRRWTPPVECGLLPGIMRAEILELGEVAERVLSVDDVRRAVNVWRVSSLRGWVRVEIEPAGGGLARNVLDFAAPQRDG